MPLIYHYLVPAIIYIDKWGRRPMLLVGTLLMGFWMFLVGGIQGRFGEWSNASGSNVWVITGNQTATRAVIVCSYLFVCRWVASSWRQLYTCVRILMSPYIVLLSRWVQYRGHTPRSWYVVLNILMHSESKGLTSIYMAVLPESPWKSRVTRYRKSLFSPRPQSPVS